MAELRASDFILQYRDIKPKLKRLETNFLTALNDMVVQEGIPIFAIESRIKEEDSLLEKVARKGYEARFESVEDLCGIRVICYYQADIDKLCKLIDDEFHVISKEDKQDELGDSQFGYRSFHYVVKLKEEWLAHPSARGLDGFKAEIQVRTMLMHTWSAISHKLLYKRVSDVPPQLLRKLNRLSALIELADEQFDSIKDMKVEYKNDFSKLDQGFDNLGDLNSDSLLALRDIYFSKREHDDKYIPGLLEDIRDAGFDLKDLAKNIEYAMPVLEELERESAEYKELELPMWSFSGVIRAVLDLTSDQFFYGREHMLPDYIKASRHKYRDILKAQK
ncbi:putative uncharacterized protein [Pseudomonas sp. StFLB209]|uniref:GTP pyrophosphokinase n=1 Tax=Pseudomonas sp. StFLB209 TaxID=1028989 RepID=UPI0004F5F1B5|nr:(p)ppGpp synthetase [Pseudomonas sp. StFLB209]BAP44789.1 putative uncharacterized protein [Pseudomonas sp. StFLB209]